MSFFKYQISSKISIKYEKCHFVAFFVAEVEGFAAVAVVVDVEVEKAVDFIVNAAVILFPLVSGCIFRHSAFCLSCFELLNSKTKLSAGIILVSLVMYLVLVSQIVSLLFLVEPLASLYLYRLLL